MKQFCFLVLIGMLSCTIKNSAVKGEAKIVNVVGEIFHNAELDNHDFNLCGDQDRIVQYYAFSEKTYEGEKSVLIQHFQNGYETVKYSKESGLMRIRFIVNCKGEAGRFRVLSMDSDYQEKEFSQEITKQLLALTKSFKGWKAMQANGKYRDYYQYLIFKIENGQLIELMP